MKLSKRVVSLICLSFMILGFDSSSINNRVNNSNLGSIKPISKNVSTTQDYNGGNIEKNEVKEKEIKKLKEDKLEEERKLKVTYLRRDMTVVSNIKKEELEAIFMNYKGASTMTHLSDALVDAEKKWGVNAFTMAAIVALESGFATSRRAVEDNNLTGYEVYSDNSEGRLFSSQYESILHTARHLSRNYLREGAIYYRGVSVDDVQVNYCPDEGKGKNWDGKVDKLASDFLKVYKSIYLY